MKHYTYEVLGVGLIVLYFGWSLLHFVVEPHAIRNDTWSVYKAMEFGRGARVALLGIYKLQSR